MQNQIRNKWKSLFCSIFFFSILAGCGSDSINWTEDVLLPDGRVVTLKRYQEFKGPYELGDTPTASDYWLEFKHPDTAEMIRWQYGRHLGTVALIIDKKIPYLLLLPRFGDSSRDFNCPNPPYVLFKYIDKNWHRIDLTSLPIKRFRSNVTDPDDKEVIKRKQFHLSVTNTQAITHNYIPWLMDFSDLKEQTFGTSNCHKQSDYKIVPTTSSDK